MPPLGIEPSPSVLQADARTIYAKAALVPDRGVEPLSSDRQSDIMNRYTNRGGLAGPEGFEPSSSVLETEILAIELRSHVINY